MACILLSVGSMRGLAVVFTRSSSVHDRIAPALRKAGATVENVELLSATIAPSPSVIVLGGDNGMDTVSMVPDVRRRFPHARVIVLVPSSAEAAAALRISHDTLLWNAAPEEMLARIFACAHSARKERELASTVCELSDRVSSLEDRLAEVRKENGQLRELAHQDELTCLGNRRHFRTQLEYATEFAGRYGGTVSVLVADLDGLKVLNDSGGHPVGDRALIRVAEVVSCAVRKTDTAARLGGDEFAVIMPATDQAAAERVAERLRARVAALAFADGMRLTVSIGVATVVATRGSSSCADDLFARADAALYRAKRSGKNRVELDSSSQKPRAA